MYLDWACIYSDDSARIKGHQYRNSSLILEQKQKTDLKNFFYIPSNFPKIPLISGKWFDSLNKFAIGCTQILPVDGRTSYITFMIFLDNENIEKINEISYILKFLTQDAIYLREFSDAKQPSPILVNDSNFSFLGEYSKCEVILKSKNIISTICDVYSKKRSNIIPIAVDEVETLIEYTALLNEIWSKLLPTVRKDFSWVGLIKYIDISFKEVTRFIFTENFTSQWETNIRLGKVLPLGSNKYNQFSINYFNSFENLSVGNPNVIFRDFNGSLNEFHLVSSFLNSLSVAESGNEVNVRIINLMSALYYINELFCDNYISKNFFDVQYEIISKKLLQEINHATNFFELQRIFADKNKLIDNQTIQSLKVKIKELVSKGQRFNKSILAHAMKFSWVREIIVDIVNDLDLSQNDCIYSLILTLYQDLSDERLTFWFSFLSPFREKVLDSLIENVTLYPTKLKLDELLFLKDVFYKNNWSEFSLIFSILLVHHKADSYQIELPFILDKIYENKENIDRFKWVIRSTWGTSKFISLYLNFLKNDAEKDHFIFVESFWEFLIENLSHLSKEPPCHFVLKLWLIILPKLSTDEKNEIFDQNFFDSILFYIINENFIDYVSVFLINLANVSGLHLYNLSSRNRKLIWSKSGSKNYLKSTSIACIQSNKPIAEIEDVLFYEIDNYLYKDSSIAISSSLVNYLKNPPTIYSLKHEVVLHGLSSYMSKVEMEMYVQNIKKKPNIFKELISAFKASKKDKYKKILPYHSVTFLNHMTFEDKLEACYPDSMVDINVGYSEWKNAFQSCLIHITGSKLDLEIICNECKLDYKRFPNGDTIGHFAAIIVNQVFDQKHMNGMRFIECVQRHFAINKTYDYSSQFNQYKLFIMLKVYFELKFNN